MDMSAVFKQMEKLDKWVLQATAQEEIKPPALSTAELYPAAYEVATAQVMRRLARIRLSRYVRSSFASQ